MKRGRLVRMWGSLVVSVACLATTAEAPMFGIAVHGGAGTIDRTKMPAKLEAEYRQTLDAARDAGYAVLERGGTALDAVETAIVIMEDSPLFNAGRGSVFTSAGKVEMDASIMDGKTGNAGGVASVRKPRNPIRAARRVLSHSKHVLLSGAGADAFAKEQGLKLEPPTWFETDRRRKQLEKIQKRGGTELDHGGKRGTVGAVALDKHGNLAAGTSTGGMTNKRWGRIGDSPIIGAGTWADNATAAVSCTGHGEFFIRHAAAHAVHARMTWGRQTLKAAARGVIQEQLAPIDADGGLIAIDAKGNLAIERNTPGMFRAWRTSSGQKGTAIWDH